MAGQALVIRPTEPGHGRCPTCNTMRVGLDPDDAAEFWLPAAVCKHVVMDYVADMEAKGMMPVRNGSDLATLRAGRVKLMVRPVAYEWGPRAHNVTPEVRVSLASYAPSWAMYVVSRAPMVVPMRKAVLLRVARDGSADVASALYASGGGDVLYAWLMRGFDAVAEHVPGDRPREA